MSSRGGSSSKLKEENDRKVDLFLRTNFPAEDNVTLNRYAKKVLKNNGFDTMTEVLKTLLNTDTDPTARGVAEKWLQQYLPDLNEDDKEDYTSWLVHNGFDSDDRLNTDLEEDDLDDFMKEGHAEMVTSLIKTNNTHPGFGGRKKQRNLYRDSTLLY
eukprot:CAMPEP_0194140642 /NCGR_PEP_ID=MMETSP0152-20130528/10171_1 /TAXON_ID=1049557 /ORGANISM="Thalassiothrix antarctica, Strain L6-D1" /LENGTH=156 /DNA_ID=CAMNT_0038838973 /DNA_START=148 /DNA_END=618 /DNA_ORIENTATION=+